MQAAQIAEAQRKNYLAGRKSFCFETVMSTRRNLDLLLRAKSSGFYIVCYFVLTIDLEINVRRVRSRVLAGGHDVPEEKIRERYGKSLALLGEVAECADAVRVIDNSSAEPEIIFSKFDGEKRKTPSPIWETISLAGSGI